MKSVILFLLFSASAIAQQLPTGPLQFVKDTKTVTVKQDTVTPGNSIALPVSVFGTVTVAGPLAVTQSGVWSVGRTWSLLDSTDSISSFTKDGSGNSITSTAGALDVNIASGTVITTNPSVSTTGTAVPASATFIGVNKAGDLVSPTLDAGDNLNVNVQTSALPSNAATEAKQDTGNTLLTSIDSKITVVDTNSVAITSSALPTGAATETTLSSIDGKVPSGLTVSSTRLLVDASGTTQPISGTVTVTQATGTNLHAVIDTSALPTGASTEAKQDTGNTSLSSIDGKTPALVSGRVPVDGSGVTQPISASSLPLPTGAATEATLSSIDGKMNSLGQKTMANSMPVVISSDQSAVATKAPVNTTGSGSGSGATVSTVTTLTAPSNAVGFILMNLDTSTANIRWAVGRTASTTLGQQLQPGRDSGFVPVGANVSVIAESGTQNIDIQWVSQ